MAGVRGRSGRKPDGAIQKFRALIDAAVTEEDWRAIVEKAGEEAKLGGALGHQAREWLAKYRWGMPTQLVGGDVDAPPIRFVKVGES
jgi:hypothetical protein